MAHDASGARDVPAAFGDWGFTIHPTGYRRGEPTLGVTSDRTIFTVGEESNVLRSRDDGKSWQVLDDGVFGPPLDSDPFLWVDPMTERVFNSRLDGSVWLAWTDDQGGSWSANPAAAVLPVADHQRLTTGPPPAGVSVNGYPNLLYIAYLSFNIFGGDTPNEGFRVAVSDDGGRTFTRDVPVFTSGDGCGTHSSVAVADDGTAYIARHRCDDVAVSRSTDGGAVWERVVELNGTEAWTLDPMMDVDDAGNAYILWQGAGGALWLSHSSDGGDSWSEPVLASHPSITSAVFPDIIAGDDGRVAIAYLGTTTPDDDWNDGERKHDPSVAGDEAVWHLYVSYLEDATGDDPTFTTARLTPDTDPVQRGCINQDSDTPNLCRNLLDFMDMVEHEGSVYVVYPDGCHACATAEDSHALGETTVVIQRSGPLLRDAQPEAGPPAPPGVPTGLDEPVPYEFTGHVDVPHYCFDQDPTVEEAVRDLASDTFEFEVPPNTRFVNGTLDWETTGPTPETSDLDLLLFDGEGDYFDANSLDVPETFTFDLLEGDQGTWTAVVQNCQNPPTDLTLSLELS
jgi:hypothetical protein